MSKKYKNQQDSKPDTESRDTAQTLADEVNGNDTPTNESDAEVIDDVVDSPETEIESLKNLLQETENNLEEKKKEYLFLMADFDNFRKRTLREKSELIKTGSETVIKSLLPFVDDFERGIESLRTTDDINVAREGMELVYNKLVKFFEQNGVKVMDTAGVEFDPEQHEALTTVPVPDDTQKNKVVDTITKGYTLNDKVIRHAKVVVGQ